MLHIISNHSIGALNQCHLYFQDGDAILFIGEGVYLMLPSKLQQLTNNNYYALKVDVEARGLMKKIPKYIQLIDYDGFVELTENHLTIQTW